MYQPMSVLQVQRSLPESGAKALTLPCVATTSSSRPESAVTTTGVFQDSGIFLARHFSSPVFRSRATSESLSTLALMNTRFFQSTGDAAEPQPCVLEPT